MDMVTIPEATKWARDYLNRGISSSNISYLVQYGKVKKHTQKGKVVIALSDLKQYYDSSTHQKKSDWKKKLGNDLNWSLSFDNLREKDTTKHVHRLHPYKGKFIPQLVEYFLDSHVDKFKKEPFFKKGDIVLDPFLGSGTTLIQANELGIHGIGIDVSTFNCLISKAKIQEYDQTKIELATSRIKDAIQRFEGDKGIKDFEQLLLNKLSEFNKEHFPSPEFKYKVNQGEIDESIYGIQKEKVFLPTYKKLLSKFDIKIENGNGGRFIDKWYIASTRKEIDFIFNEIQKESDESIRELLSIILSRSIRSARATSHSDLATLKEPLLTTYYCFKHRKICKPLFSMTKIFDRYARDTTQRVLDFKQVKSDAQHLIIDGDSRMVDIFSEAREKNKKFHSVLKNKKIDGIFSSPPYVGQIDYHEQHSYAYNLFKFERRDESEIGPLYKGKGIKAKESYVKGISDVLNNCKRFLKPDYDIFLVANDQHNLYPSIADRAGMTIVNRYKRPVLNRTERDRNPYSEIIFHLKEVK